METFTDVVRRLDAVLAERRPGYYGQLKRPLDDAGLRDWGEALGLRLPPDLAAVYAWKDGQSGAPPEPLFGQWVFQPSAIAAELKRSYDAISSKGRVRPGYWDPSWVPWLADEEGHLLCVDAGGRLVSFSSDQPERAVLAPDLGSTVRALVEAVEGADGPPEAVSWPPGYPRPIERG